jgi:transposase-like protein
MAQGRRRDERKEQQWRRWFGEWQTSGLSVRAFCARRGLAESLFYAWRRRLEERAAARPAFLPVHIVADQAAAAGNALEVVLADGRSVRVAAGFDAATLRRLLSVLEEKPPC